MIPNLEKPQILEIKIRMDCNGCVQKIKKALHGINGIYEIYIDFPQQKLTVVGWADQEKVMKAIKKTRKIATICTHPESNENPPPPAENPTLENPPPPVAENPPPPTENPPPPPENPPPSEVTNPPAADSTPPPPPPPPPTPTPTPPPPPENTIPEVTPSAVATDTAASLPSGPTETKDVEVIHVIDRQTHDYKYTMHHNGGPGFRHGAGAPHYVSYNYRPAVYVPEYGYAPSPSRNSRFTRVEHNVDDHPHRMEGNGNNITSMFSDENPNACSVM